ncbi:MAG: alpha/beta hydrolase [Clostridia bacterium]|nr:alpha/beta hydrolase [Clostridia bacterium]MDD4386154.1 alpha/beta hydrolase [Clostridia bacterium]
MNVNINDININYEMLGENNIQSVLILHGWGANLQTMLPVSKYLSKKYKVYTIDLPGFGKSSEPNSTYTVTDYATVVIKFCEAMNIKVPTLIGHSFGGRVILKMVGELSYIAKNIIFVDSAGIKPKRSIKYYFKVYSFKIIKNVIKLFCNNEKSEKIISNLRKNAGSSDYQAASENMKKVFINVVNEDLKYCLPKINVPTLLIWGENDKDTPLRDAKVFEKLIPDSGLIVFKDAGHYSYLDKLGDFLVIILKFMEG